MKNQSCLKCLGPGFSDLMVEMAGLFRYRVSRAATAYVRNLRFESRVEENVTYTDEEEKPGGSFYCYSY